MGWDKKARLAHSEKMRASHARRKAARAEKQVTLEEAQAAINAIVRDKSEVLNTTATRAFFVNPTTLKTTPVDLSDAVRNIYMMTFYRDGTINVVEVI